MHRVVAGTTAIPTPAATRPTISEDSCASLTTFGWRAGLVRNQIEHQSRSRFRKRHGSACRYHGTAGQFLQLQVDVGWCRADRHDLLLCAHLVFGFQLYLCHDGAKQDRLFGTLHQLGWHPALCRHRIYNDLASHHVAGVCRFDQQGILTPAKNSAKGGQRRGTRTQPSPHK